MKDVQVVTPNRYNYLHSTSTNLSIATQGLQKLVQEVVLHLKRTPNRDLIDPSIGSGLRTLLPLSIGTRTQQQVFATVASSITKIKNDIKDSQHNEPLTPDEKLADIELLEATFSPNETAWFITLRVTSQGAGKAEIITLI